jgi:hypothetical protein
VYANQQPPIQICHGIFRFAPGHYLSHHDVQVPVIIRSSLAIQKANTSLKESATHVPGRSSQGNLVNWPGNLLGNPCRFPHPILGLKKWSKAGEHQHVYLEDHPTWWSRPHSVGLFHGWCNRSYKPQKFTNPWDDQTASLLENSKKRQLSPGFIDDFPMKTSIYRWLTFFSQPETSIKSSPSSTRSQARTPSW